MVSIGFFKSSGSVRALLLITALLCIDRVQAFGRVVQYQELRQEVFGSIINLENCEGGFEKGERFYNYRFIEAWYQGQSMLFVDLVATDNPESHLWVVRGFTFREFNDDHAATSLDSVECHLLYEDQAELRIVETSGHDMKTRHYRLLVNGLGGSYSLEELPSSSKP